MPCRVPVTLPSSARVVRRAATSLQILYSRRLATLATTSSLKQRDKLFHKGHDELIGTCRQAHQSCRCDDHKYDGIGSHQQPIVANSLRSEELSACFMNLGAHMEVKHKTQDNPDCNCGYEARLCVLVHGNSMLESSGRRTRSAWTACRAVIAYLWTRSLEQRAADLRGIEIDVTTWTCGVYLSGPV